MSGASLLAKLLGSAAPAVAAAGNAAAATGAIAGSDQTVNLEQLSTDAFEMGRAQGAVEGRTAERERFGAVLTSDLGASHSGLAITMLSTTDLSADVIATQLVAADKAAPAAAATPPAPIAPVLAPQAGAVDPLAASTPIVAVGAAAGATDEIDAETINAGWSAAIGHEAAILKGGGFAIAGHRAN